MKARAANPSGQNRRFKVPAKLNFNAVKVFHGVFHLTLIMLLHYLVKIENSQ